jgi:Ni,Fe-hydrogenase III component G
VKENANKFHHLMYLWQQEKNKPKPYIIVIMATRKIRTNKFYHLLYLCQQEKNKPKPSIIVIMATRKKNPNLPSL